MSKASEWATQWKSAQDSKPLGIKQHREKPGPYIDAAVSEVGECHVYVNGDWVATLPPHYARELAGWILDTFGEATP